MPRRAKGLQRSACKKVSKVVIYNLDAILFAIEFAFGSTQQLKGPRLHSLVKLGCLCLVSKNLFQHCINCLIDGFKMDSSAESPHISRNK